MEASRLRQIADDPAFFVGQPDQGLPPPPPQPQPRLNIGIENTATNMLLLALRALSQRAVVALGNLFVLLTAGSAWWLWWATLPNPSTYQLVGLALYGGLILALDWMVLRRS